ncbi:MAG: acyltransferase, partial [Thermodesulfovibrionia bacterium]|nr:acyltransferase [Thermodesulfovibrionia bacterium]
MKAGCYQFSPSFGNKKQNIEKVASAIKNAASDLIVLPEFFATGYQFTSTDEVAGFSEPIP